MNRRERRERWQASLRAGTASQVASALAAAPVAGTAPRARAAPTGSALNLQIGELVLRGFEKRYSSRIAAAFESSLRERLRTGALPGALPGALRHRASSTSLRLAPFTLRRPNDPAAIGEQLAASVFAFERDARRRGGSR